MLSLLRLVYLSFEYRKRIIRGTKYYTLMNDFLVSKTPKLFILTLLKHLGSFKLLIH